MKSAKPVTTFAPHETRRFISPLTIATIVIFVVILIESISGHSSPNFLLIIFGSIGIAYIMVAHSLIVQSSFRIESYKILNAILTGIGLGILSFLMPRSMDEVLHILVVFSVIVIATISGRLHAYITIILFGIISIPTVYSQPYNTNTTFNYLTPLIVSLVILEVIIRIKSTTQQHIHQLETINKVSRQIMQTLDTRTTFSLLNSTIQETLDADTYFIGIVQGDKIKLELFYDDKEYFNGISIPADGTLSSWVINNQKELFLPDLREEIVLDGVEQIVIGKEKTSLSWIGVPLQAENVTGILALASYTANAFDRADLELLTSLGQYVTIALDNTIRHAQVKKQALLDSMTGVYNHGYFLELLAEQVNEVTALQQPLSLIMLDIDYFKQYNDTYGHLVGDRILNTLCAAIQHNIKQTDAVGRWGGEEFVISLPGATGSQAYQIARRICETMKSLRVVDRDQNAVPIPTISQGIAVFSSEADEIYRLLDIADRRLYVAKERGRNQIEPTADFWAK